MWNTVSARIRGAATELVDMGEETDQYVESTSKLRDLVKGYTGFDIMDDENNFKDLYEIVLGIGEAWGDLEDIQKAALGEALGGKRNARGLYSIFDHLDTLTSAYETSVNSAGSAAREQEHYAESIQYSIDRTKASLQELSVDFLSSDLLKGLIEGANRVLQVLDDIISRFGTIKTLLAGASIADFGRGLFTGKGIFAGVFEHLAGKSGEASASGNMLSNILTVFGSSKATKMATKAGEDVGEAVETGFKTVLKEIDIGGGEKEFAEILIPTTTGKIAGEKLGNDMAKSAPKTAKNFVSKFVGAISAHPIAAAIGGVAIAGLIAKNAYDRYKANQISTANTATDKYNDTKATIESYKSQYQTLYKQLHDANTTEAEGIEIRKQIVDLQSQITEQYGAQASGVDLVNGKLDEQLSKLDQIVSKNAQDAFADGDTKKAYKDATKEMNRQDREYSFGFFNQQYSDEKGSLHERIQEIADEIEGVTYGDAGNGFYELKFNGNVTDAEAAIETLKNRVVELRRDFKDDDSALFEIDQLGDNLTKQGKKVSDTIGKYRDNWLSGLEQGFHEEFYGKEQDSLLADYEEANRKYNESIASEDVDAFAEAQAERQEILEKLQGTYGNDEEGRNKYKSQIEPLVSDMDTIIDKSSEFKMNVRDLVDENGNLVDKSSINNTNEFKDNIDGIKESFEGLKNLNLDEADFKEMTADIEKFGDADPAIKKLGESLGLSFDDVDTYADNINLLSLAIAEMGGFTNTASTETEEAAQKFEDFRSSIIKDIANIDTLNGAIAESFSGKGLSYSVDENGEVVGAISEIKKAYGELMQEAEVDESALFQSTALGLKTNQTALRALQSELEAKNKLELNNQLEEAQKKVGDLQSRFGKMDKEAFPERYDKLKGELDAAKSNLESVRELQAAYEGATSAYQKWVNAQSMGEEGDVYNAIRETAFKRGDELLEQGLVGTNEFRAIAQMFSDEDLSTAGIDKIISEYQAGSAAVKSFFTEGYEGLAKFGADAASKGIEGIREVRDEAGNLGYAFENVDVQKIADTYGVSASVIESIFGRMADYGIEVQRYSADATADLEKLNQKAKDAQEAIKGLDDTSVELQSTGKTVKASDIIDFNIDDLDTKTELENKISDLNDLQIKLGADTEEGKQVGELLDQLKQKKEAISQATNIPMGYSDLETANTAASQLKDRINEISNSEHVTDIDVAIQNDEQVNTLAQNIASLPKEAQIEIGVKEENAGSAQAIVQQIQENPASIKVTPELVKDDLNQEGTIKYSTEITKPLPESELNKKGTITYISKMGKALNPAQLNKKQTINQTTNVTKNETTNKTLNTTVTGNAAQESNQIRNAIASIPDQKIVVISAIDSATVKIQKVKSEKIKDKVFVIKATDDATAVVNSVKGNNIPDKSFNVTANTTTAINAVTRIKNLVDGLRSKEITITTKRREVNAANGTAHWQGTAGGYYSPKRNGSVGNSFINHYNGTAYARGNWGLKRDEPNALINELGPEIVVLCKLCYHVW